MRFCVFICVLMVSSWWFVAMVYGESSRSHDILHSLASSRLEVVSWEGVSFGLPGHWESRRISGGILFSDPNLRDVLGGVWLLDEDAGGVEGAVMKVGALFPTTLEVMQRQEVTLQGGMRGVRVLAQGRVGGGVWRFLIFRSVLADGRSYVFFAQAPKHWFGTYGVLFDEILESLQVSTSRTLAAGRKPLGNSGFLGHCCGS
ncbi:MAG: hypothetical protein FWC40_07790 [Proteobacteria bacterium]|nr:hypothetical protein [Pseudomonadota bacterium]